MKTNLIKKLSGKGIYLSEPISIKGKNEPQRIIISPVNGNITYVNASDPCFISGNDCFVEQAIC